MQFAAGAPDPKLFTPDASARIFPERAKQIAERLNALSLPIAVISMSELIERRDENGVRIYKYALTDMGRTLFCTVGLTAENKITILLI